MVKKREIFADGELNLPRFTFYECTSDEVRDVVFRQMMNQNTFYLKDNDEKNSF